MRIFLAGGHTAAGTTRSAAKVGLVRGLGAEPVAVDVYDARAMHQLTDLPDEAA